MVIGEDFAGDEKLLRLVSGSSGVWRVKKWSERAEVLLNVSGHLKHWNRRVWDTECDFKSSAFSKAALHMAH